MAHVGKGDSIAETVLTQADLRVAKWITPKFTFTPLPYYKGTSFPLQEVIGTSYHFYTL